ncbi:hypothetical protein CPLU01_04272 [Colletotrichum plurivorum]|uniref:Uncharacterized protein n=1 Tax=Colletotrichum plurivorum TaxID=2175906 RepID=A0A8H6KQV2_9PEZI|nr:hypothetical protein CPLU01_04272 [Colletotrichum plurivorum]
MKDSDKPTKELFETLALHKAISREGPPRTEGTQLEGVAQSQGFTSWQRLNPSSRETEYALMPTQDVTSIQTPKHERCCTESLSALTRKKYLADGAGCWACVYTSRDPEAVKRHIREKHDGKSTAAIVRNLHL